MNVSSYTDVAETLPDPVLLAPLLDIDSIAGRRVLVADDVADSGRTLQLVMDILLNHGAEVRTAVLYASHLDLPGRLRLEDRRLDRLPLVGAAPVGSASATDAGAGSR